MRARRRAASLPRTGEFAAADAGARPAPVGGVKFGTFEGQGTPPIAEGKQAMFYRPWLVVLPGICLFLLVIGANLMGDGLRDITSPEGRNE